MLIVSLIIVLLYVVLILWFYIGFNKVEDISLSDIKARNTFSILVAYRNEVNNLKPLLESLNQLEYPKSQFEVLFINDESSDESSKLIKAFFKNPKNAKGKRGIDYRILETQRTSNSPKKDALAEGIKNSKYNYIVTTDADCQVPKYWLDSFDYSLQIKEANMLAGPVKISNASNFLNRFQIFEFLSLQAISVGAFGIGKPFMCNGANLCYEKAIFYSVNGFKDNNHIASGDDIFLLEKMLKHDASKVHFIKDKNAVVITKPVNNWKNLIEQHQRWAAKSANYDVLISKITGVIALLMNFWCVVAIPIALLELLDIKAVLLIVLIKISVDFLLIFKSSRFFEQEEVLLSYLSASLVYPFFSSLVSLKALLDTYNWKGRKFKK